MMSGANGPSVIRLLCCSIVLTAHVVAFAYQGREGQELGRYAIKNRGVLLGYVEAPDEKAAELVAAKS
jgi:hypothetical protein